MQVSGATLILGAVVLAAGSYAIGRETAPAETLRIVESPQPAVDPGEGTEAPGEPDPHGMSGLAGQSAGTGTAGAPNGPTIQDPHSMTGGGPGPSPDTELAAITWTVPPSWRTAPNTSSMRLATYTVPHASGDPVDAEVSVTRAGGDIASNVNRWVGQFNSAGQPKQSTRTIKSLSVTTVEIEGTYTNGMDPTAKPREGWALLAAIVSTKAAGQPYFFKMTGPAATVHAATAAFGGMIDGIKPAAAGSPL